MGNPKHTRCRIVWSIDWGKSFISEFYDIPLGVKDVVFIIITHLINAHRHKNLSEEVITFRRMNK